MKEPPALNEASGSAGTLYVVLPTLVAAIGGLFGCDTAAIAGAIGFFQSYFAFGFRGE